MPKTKNKSTVSKLRPAGGGGQDVEGQIKKIIALIARAKESDITYGINLRDELGLDSLNAMEILAAIETKYSIHIDEARAFDIVTVRDLYNLVKKCLKEQA